MPLVRRKQVAMHPVPPELVANPNDTRDVFLLDETGELFLDYESYAARMTFYKMKVFQCETTGKGGLDYFQALQSEQNEASTLLARFPEPLKAAVLRSVQWRVVGRLDSLVDQVYDRYIDRYHAGEKIFVDVQGEKYWARVLKVFPPKALVATLSAPPPPANISSTTNPLGLSPLNPNFRPNGLGPNSILNSSPPLTVDLASIAHRIGGDLSLPPAEAFAKDDPAAYFYQVQLIEEGDEEDAPPEINGHGPSGSGTKWAGSTMEVQMGVMSRDRLAFSKSILRRFIRECVTRDAAIASPWCVKPALAARYGLETEMPLEMRQSAERVKAGELEKRKKVWEEKEERERPFKKSKKLDENGEGSRAPSKAKETPAPAPVRRYPIEDLDVVLNDRDRKAGRLEVRPPLNLDVPFAEWGPGACEKFLSVWFMLTAFSKPLQLNFFTMDEFEQALNHVYTPPTPSRPVRVVPMMAEIYATLLWHIRDRGRVDKPGTVSRQEAIGSLRAQEDAIADSTYELETEEERARAEAELERSLLVASSGAEEDVQAHVWRTKLGGLKLREVSLGAVVSAIEEVSGIYPAWKRAEIGTSDERSGWEDVLLGCLAEHATVETFPRLRSIVGQLAFPPIVSTPSTAQSETAPKIATLDEPQSDSDSDAGSVHGEDQTKTLLWGWAALTPRDKLEILSFLADLAMASRSVRIFMDECDSRLTTLRKEKIEVNRERKRVAEMLEEAGVSVTKMEEKMNAELDELGVGDGSEPGSKSATPLPENAPSRRKSRNAAPSSTGHSTPDPHPVNQRAAARAQAAEHKGLVKARQGHVEEAARLEKQLAEIEREFRQLLGATRMKPLGKDRFYNRVWWFDGVAGVGKSVEAKGNKGKGRAVEKEREKEAQGVGRIFVQGPERGEWEYVMAARDERAVRARRLVEEGEGCVLEPGEWAMYSEPEQIDEFVSWLNPKGTRELHLKNALAKWREPLMAAVGKRSGDISGAARGQASETRRSSRVKVGAVDMARDSYLNWTNKRTK